MILKRLIYAFLVLNIFRIPLAFADNDTSDDVDSDEGPCVCCEWPFGPSNH